ncbi:MAG: hypothetical protein ABI562_03295 [Chloroflexota bacterium]
MAQAGTTLGLGQSRTTMANKPLGFWPVAIVAALAVAIVLATAFLVATTKIGTVDRSYTQIETQRGAAVLPAPAPNLTREQIMAQRDADSAPIAAGGAIERYYSSSAAQHSSVLQKGPASGYSDAEAQRGLHGKLR